MSPLPRRIIRAAALRGLKLALLIGLAGVTSLTASPLAAQTSSRGSSRARRDEPRPAIYRGSDGVWRVDLPPAMEDALDRYNRDFDPWGLNDYGGLLRTLDDREYAFSSRQTPWAVIGDFNGDGRYDIALSGRDDRDALVVLILSNGQRKYRAVELESEPYDPDDPRSVRPALLQYLYPGHYVIDDPRLRRPREIIVDLPAVQVTGGRRQGATIYVVENNTVLPYYLSDRTAPPAKPRADRRDDSHSRASTTRPAE